MTEWYYRGWTKAAAKPLGVQLLWLSSRATSAHNRSTTAIFSLLTCIAHA